MFDFLYSMLGLNLEFLEPIVDVLNVILIPVVSLLATAGTIYAIVLGVQMARADSTEKREEAKKRVINVLIGMAIAVGLILLIKLFMNYLPGWIGKPNETT